jgi:hypothetical protein
MMALPAKRKRARTHAARLRQLDDGVMTKRAGIFRSGSAVEPRAFHVLAEA